MIDLSYIKKEDLIRGELFPTLADSQYRRIYCKIDHAPHFLINFAPRISHPFVFITHNGDLPVSEMLLGLAKTIPNLKRWFGQNIECQKNQLIESIPIGLENTSNFPELKKLDKLYYMIQSCSNIDPTRLLYLNFSFSTNKLERESAWKMVKTSCPHFTDKCQSSIQQSEFSSWLSDVVDHHYVLCPRGNGIDTHRLWETLYLGRIPIVKRNTNTKYYEDLPILLVDDWSDVTQELLEKSLPFYSQSTNFNLEKLKFSWWKAKIENVSL